MQLIVPPINISDDDGFNSDVDIFNRKPFGESLLNLINNTDNELVLALDAPWGEGKTTFINMWQGLLKEKNIPHVYFDAFENDYQQDPFLAISRQIYQLIDEGDEEAHQQFKDKATTALKVFGRAGLRIGIKALTAGVLDETILEDTGSIGDASKEASNILDDFVSNQLTKAEQDRQSLQAFKQHLSSLSEDKIIFIIDELDRCKPKFALSLLESIKHLFSVPNISFILVMNSSQLEEAVRCEYGRGVDAAKYLQKFVSIWTTLPKPTDEHHSVPRKYLHNCLIRMGYESKSRTQQNTISFFEDISAYYDLSLREIEKSLTSFAIIHNATDGNLNISYSILAVFISVLKSAKQDVYRKLLKDSLTYDEIIVGASLKDMNADWWGDKPEGHPIKWLLKYYLSTDDEAKALIEEGSYLEVREGYGRDAISNICLWLESFKRD